MPFTLAHPAAVLPLRGLKYLRTAPLIIGAITPDLPYYVPARLAHFGPETHSLTGAFTTCLVLGYAALGCIYLLRRPLTALLSARARWLYLTALAPFSGRPLEWALADVERIKAEKPLVTSTVRYQELLRCIDYLKSRLEK